MKHIMGERRENLQAVRDCEFEARTKAMLAMRKGTPMKDALLAVVNEDRIWCQDAVQRPGVAAGPGLKGQCPGKFGATLTKGGGQKGYGGGKNMKDAGGNALKNKPPQGGGGGGGKGKGTCRYCGEEGHWGDECPHKEFYIQALQAAKHTSRKN